jgi:hypothetical protein
MVPIVLIVGGVFWSGIGLWALAYGLPEVRVRVRSGNGSPSDVARLKNNRKVGIGFAISGLLIVIAGVLQL